MSSQYGEYINIDELHYALVNDSKDAYTAGANNYLAPAGQISHDPSVKQNTRYYDGIAMFTTSTEGETKVAVTVSGVPIMLGAILTGKFYDSTKGILIDTGEADNAPWATLSGRMELGDGGYRYFQYLKGKYSIGKEEAETKGDDIKPKTVELTYTAVATMFQWTVNNVKKSVKALKADSIDPAFKGADNWFNSIQTPDTAGATIAEIEVSSTNPANNATGILLTAAAPTITFNNVISNYSNVALINTTDDTFVATTKSLDATGKILTITPSALVASKTYAIILQGVTDIYGQVLAPQLIKFTTAAS